MKLKTMTAANAALIEIEAILVGWPIPKTQIARTLKQRFLTPFAFIWLGFTELIRQFVFWAFVVFSAIVGLALVLPPLMEIVQTSTAILFDPIFIILLLLTGLAAFFSAPSVIGTMHIGDDLVENARDIFKDHGLHLNDQTRATLIDSFESSTKSRIRVWLALAAFIWGITWYMMRKVAENAAIAGDMDELVPWVFVALGILLVASAYSKACRKLVFLLKFADAAILDERYDEAKLVNAA